MLNAFVVVVVATIVKKKWLFASHYFGISRGCQRICHDVGDIGSLSVSICTSDVNKNITFPWSDYLKAHPYETLLLIYQTFIVDLN